MQDILTANQTARVIGCGPQRVRERIKRGIWTFGSVVTRKESGNAQKNTYEINKYSVVIYYLTFVLLLNLFMVLKRIFNVIDCDMRVEDN